MSNVTAKPVPLSKSEYVLVNKTYFDQKGVAPRDADTMSVLDGSMGEKKISPVVKNAEIEHKECFGATFAPAKMLEKPTLCKASAGKLNGPIASAIGLRMKPLTTVLALTGSSLSGAGAALTTVIPIEPASTNEWSSISSLYDEYKVEGGELHYVTTSNVDAAGAPASLGVVIFDPSGSNAALTSVAQGAQFSSSQLFSAPPLQTSGYVVSPQSVNLSGLREFKFKELKGAKFSTATGLSVTTGAWMSTFDSADIAGNLKFYVQGDGATGDVTVVYCLKLRVSFRSRR